jgi:hypothetical protein
MWAGMRSYSEFASRVVSWSNDEVLAAMKTTPDVEQQITVANYIEALLEDLDAYPFSRDNEAALRTYTEKASDVRFRNHGRRQGVPHS